MVVGIKIKTIEVGKNDFADVSAGNYIRIYGERYGKQFDRLFRIDDEAEYDRFNLSYMGVISQITTKTVTIIPYRGGKPKRLKIEKFFELNWDFDSNERRQANEIARQNF